MGIGKKIILVILGLVGLYLFMVYNPDCHHDYSGYLKFEPGGVPAVCNVTGWIVVSLGGGLITYGLWAIYKDFIEKPD